MNKLGIWVIAIAFAFALGTMFSADIATAAKPVTEVFVTNQACPADKVLHWFFYRLDATPILKHDSEPSITTFAEISLAITSSQVINHDTLREHVADRLNELGYFVTEAGEDRQVEASDIDTVTLPVAITSICSDSGQGIIQPG